MDDLTAALTKHRKRLGEIMAVLGRYGLADWAERGGVAGVKLAQHYADPELVALSPVSGCGRGDRARARPSSSSARCSVCARPRRGRVASELEKLQASVPPDPPGVARRSWSTSSESRSMSRSRRSTPSRWVPVRWRRCTRPPCTTAPRSWSRCCTTASSTRSTRTSSSCGPSPQYVERRGCRARPLPPHDDRGRVRQDDAGRHRPGPGAREPAAVHRQLLRRARRRDPDAVPGALDQPGPHDEPARRPAAGGSRRARGGGMGRGRPRPPGHRDLSRDDLPRRRVPRRPSSRQLLAARRPPPGHPRLRRRRATSARRDGRSSKSSSSRSARATSTTSPTRSWR